MGRGAASSRLGGAGARARRLTRPIMLAALRTRVAIGAHLALVIDLATAKSLGATIAQSSLLRADEVLHR